MRVVGVRRSSWRIPADHSIRSQVSLLQPLLRRKFPIGNELDSFHAFRFTRLTCFTRCRLFVSRPVHRSGVRRQRIRRWHAPVKRSAASRWRIGVLHQRQTGPTGSLQTGLKTLARTEIAEGVLDAYARPPARTSGVWKISCAWNRRWSRVFLVRHYDEVRERILATAASYDITKM